MEYAHANPADRTIIVADAQTAGRGRYRRTWSSPPGNLYASFIYHVGDARDPKISYGVAVAVAETLAHFGLHPAIKWPNDILIDGAKISGILIEYSRDFVIIGIGINIESSPSDLPYATTKTANYKCVSRDELLHVLADKMDLWTRRDFASVRERWMQLAAGIGTEIMYRGTPATLCELNMDGALVLRRGGEYLRIIDDEILI